MMKINLPDINTNNSVVLTEFKKISKKDIAIIGIAVKLPMADNIEEFWSNLCNGVECVSDFPESRRYDIDNYLHFIGKSEEQLKYYKAAFLDVIDKFDYKFFKLSPKEASIMAPVQRLSLETSWQVLEDAGYGGNKLVGSKTGVYFGFEENLVYNYGKMIFDVDHKSTQIAVAGNITATIPSRISYYLDFKGPTMVVDTACSSSLVAIHLACQGIKNGDCNMAIVGGAKIYLCPVDDPEEKIGIESPDFHTKSFDDRSLGTVGGEGVVTVLLKPLLEALKDKDNIYAVIKGSAINQDGNSASLTAPNALAQADVIQKAWQQAGVDPETISYIEAHGTGTPMGDPIEIDGITKAFRKYTDKVQFCGIGSVKTNNGHLYEGSGILGLVKAALALKYRKIPANIHFEIPNHNAHFETSPVYVVDKLLPWESHEFPRRCGVNAFGFSGTNCHVVLEEVPVSYEDTPDQKDNNKKMYVFTLSAKSSTALDSLIYQYRDYFNRENDMNVAEVCYITNTARGHYNLRLAIIVEHFSELKALLNQLNISNIQDKIGSGEIYFGESKHVGNKVVNESNDLTDKEKNDLTALSVEKLKLFCETNKTNWNLLDEICQWFRLTALPI